MVSKISKKRRKKGLTKVVGGGNILPAPGKPGALGKQNKEQQSAKDLKRNHGQRFKYLSV